MRPLQDKCDPTPYEDVNALFVSDMGRPLSEIFDYFNPEPIGVASLAQVHIAHHRESGKTVAVKVRRFGNALFMRIDTDRRSCNTRIYWSSARSIWRWLS
jgi:aarF domain-containing kinase